MIKTIQTKVIIVLGVILLLSTVIVAVLNSRHQTDALNQLESSGDQALSWALRGQIEQIMLAGENDLLQPVTEEAVARGVLEELSVINSEGIVARSSNHEIIGKPTTDLLWKSLLETGQDTAVEAELNGIPVQVSYTMLANEGGCLDCHDSDTEPILGGCKKVVSKEEMAAAVSGGRRMNIWLGLVSAILVIGGSTLLLRKMVFRPIDSVNTKLRLASMGEIDQDLDHRGNDEIGKFVSSLQGLIDYVRGFADASDQIASGDLRVDVTARSENDRLSKSFSRMVSSLDRIIGELSTSAESLSTAATEIASTSEQMSEGVRNQNDQASQVSAAIEEMSSGLLETSRSTEQMRGLSSNANERASDGSDKVTRTIESMEAIAQVVAQSSQSIKELTGSASQIQGVVEVISDIAEQTNLLALNAAIEAARAGDQGRGFAVVADEVRKLAEKTAKATEEIHQTAAYILQGSEGAVTNMHKSVEQVEQGQALAREAGASLMQILETIANVDETINQISVASNEQSTTSEEISRATTSIVAVTAESAKGAEESALAAEQLNQQAESLLRIVHRFKRRETA